MGAKRAPVVSTRRSLKAVGCLATGLTHSLEAGRAACFPIPGWAHLPVPGLSVGDYRGSQRARAGLPVATSAGRDQMPIRSRGNLHTFEDARTQHCRFFSPCCRPGCCPHVRRTGRGERQLQEQARPEPPKVQMGFTGAPSAMDRCALLTLRP